MLSSVAIRNILTERLSLLSLFRETVYHYIRWYVTMVQDNSVFIAPYIHTYMSLHISYTKH